MLIVRVCALFRLSNVRSVFLSFAKRRRSTHTILNIKQEEKKHEDLLEEYLKKDEGEDARFLAHASSPSPSRKRVIRKRLPTLVDCVAALRDGGLS